MKCFPSLIRFGLDLRHRQWKAVSILARITSSVTFGWSGCNWTNRTDRGNSLNRWRLDSDRAYFHSIGVSLAIYDMRLVSFHLHLEAENESDTPFGSPWRTLRTLVLLRHPPQNFTECGNQMPRTALSTVDIDTGNRSLVFVFLTFPEQKRAQLRTLVFEKLPASQSTNDLVFCFANPRNKR